MQIYFRRVFWKEFGLKQLHGRFLGAVVELRRGLVGIVALLASILLLLQTYHLFAFGLALSDFLEDDLFVQIAAVLVLLLVLVLIPWVKLEEEV